MTDSESRFLAALPAYGICTLRRALYRSGMSTTIGFKAAIALERADLLAVTVEGWSEQLSLGALLELTEAGREAQRAIVLAGVEAVK